jgi:hypothetical protein
VSILEAYSLILVTNSRRQQGTSQLSKAIQSFHLLQLLLKLKAMLDKRINFIANLEVSLESKTMIQLLMHKAKFLPRKISQQIFSLLR